MINNTYLINLFFYSIDIEYFHQYAESIPSGETSLAISKAASDHNIYIIAGTIPEKDDDKLYNTCTVWDNQGRLIAKHRKAST